jgi:hypothetical protein
VHVQALDWVTRQSRGLGPVAVLEIGSLDINGGVRSLFDATHYHGLDLADGPGVDEVADAADWRPARTYDVVVSTEVLEHAPRWRDVLANAWAGVADRGRLLMTCATDPRAPHSAIDGWQVRPGEHYANVAPAAVQAVVDDWVTAGWSLEVALDRGDLYLRVDKP